MSEKLMSPQEVEQGCDLLTSLRTGLARVLLGQDELLDLVVIAMAARGHLLLEGLPGLGKTELVRALGRLLGLSMKRIQFTPDLLPTDITGGPVLEEQDGRRAFIFQPGPLFANLVLADEINRASPKTQSALLEAMQEGGVTVMGEGHRLPDPFFVLATQNPIELEGTYPLPEAQLDRFLFKVNVPNVGAEVLEQIITRRRRGQPPQVDKVLDEAQVKDLFTAISRVFLSAPVASYIARLTAATHATSPHAPAAARRLCKHGASPRAAIAMGEAARAAALLAGRPAVDFGDVKKVATAALAHRLVLEHSTRLAGMDGSGVVAMLLEQVPELAQELPGEVK